MRLFIAPELLLPCTWAQRPEALVRRHGATRTTFGYLSAGPVAGSRCGRRNNLPDERLSQFTDDGGSSDGEVALR